MRALALVTLALALAGCATPGATTENDPWEPMNRKFFWFNTQLDDFVLEPTARGWNAITTPGVQRSVDRFFVNLVAPVHLANNLLQAKFVGAAIETGRFVVNTTVGLLGFFDPASDWGMPDQSEDFGQTLAVWGVSSGPYLVLPFLGPSNPRDTVGFVGDIATYSYAWNFDEVVVWASYGVNLVNGRALLLEPVRQAKEASVDYYAFVRNAFLQRRRTAIEGEQTEPKVNGDDLYDDELYNDDLYDDDLYDVDEDDSGAESGADTEPQPTDSADVPQT